MVERTEPGEITLVDLDRTALDTVRYGKEFQKFIAEHDKDLAASMAQEQQQVEAGDRSFDMYNYLVLHIGQDAADKLNEDFIKRAQRKEIKNLLNPGFEDFFAWMSWRKEAFGIFTVGSEASQTTKLRSTGLDKYPHLITQNQKGAELASWVQPDGTFVVPAALALGDIAVFSSVNTLDDKRDAYVGAPKDGVREFIYRRPGVMLLPSQDHVGNPDAVDISDPNELADDIAKRRPLA